MSRRTFLLLQGLASPFFHRLAGLLRASGHEVLRINLSGADLVFWPEWAINFRGTPAQWPAFVAKVMRERRITDLVVFGDCRPYHRVALEAARQLGADRHLAEDIAQSVFVLLARKSGSLLEHPSLAGWLHTATPTGKLVLNVLGAIGQFEREVMLERQREGIHRAKREGKYKGRKPTARAKSADIVKLAGEGMKREDIASRLNVGVASVYRALAERRAAS